ncbi:MAG: tRNA uridine-5-carboxymethylaminomethyl(34) synthesis GTPase MnmE, partial [SAR324 cluster bacterium]|nr:tRNA uridine-5-carboxymethylaminomethyl(34) synthesis GTPase MnmE [SAR324 cluster bacterium]
MDRDTIVALATAAVPAGLGVIRVSGDKAKMALNTIFKAKTSPLDDPRRLILGKVVDPINNSTIDKAFAVYMPSPSTYTGEDIVEFQFHGSPLVAQKIIGSLLSLGFRVAEAGEFTKRAFLNAKIDLVQAEAIGDLIHAGSERALEIAEEQLEGRFSKAIEEIGEPLRQELAELEASIDFPEEEIETQQQQNLFIVVDSAISSIDKLLSSYRYGQVLKDGFKVLLCGSPNVGKSTLFNKFLGRSRAIVTDISGTTRDLLEEHVLIDGQAFVFCDSAGIRQSEDAIEQIGISLALDRFSWADLILFVVDSTESCESAKEFIEDKEHKFWLILNKIDLAKDRYNLSELSKLSLPSFRVSALTGQGIDELSNALVAELKNTLGFQSETSLIVANERQKDCLLRAREALTKLKQGAVEGAPLEILCADLWSA